MKAEEYKTASINRYLATLHAAFYQAMRNGKAERNPFEQLKPEKENNKRIRWLSDEEEHRLFQVPPRQYHPLVRVALHTGLRKTEQLSLTWADVNFKAKIITIRQSKSGEPRLIPINSILEETLRKIPQRGSQSNAAVEASREAARLLEQARPLVEGGKLQEAIALLENALRLDPANPRLRFRLAGLYFDTRQYEAARLQAREAILVAPARVVVSLSAQVGGASRWKRRSGPRKSGNGGSSESVSGPGFQPVG